MTTHSYVNEELIFEDVYVSPDAILLGQLDKLINKHFRVRKDPAFYASQLAYSERGAFQPVQVLSWQDRVWFNTE